MKIICPALDREEPASKKGIAEIVPLLENKEIAKASYGIGHKIGNVFGKISRFFQGK